MATSDSKNKGRAISSTNNVIELAPYRRKKSQSSCHTVFYLTEQGCWSQLLNSFGFIQLKELRTMKTLNTALNVHMPELIFLESGISWTAPIALAKDLKRREIPIVLITDSPSDEPNLLKEAYEAGISDTLFTPLCRNEIFETLEVLLKYQKQLRFYH